MSNIDLFGGFTAVRDVTVNHIGIANVLNANEDGALFFDYATGPKNATRLLQSMRANGIRILRKVIQRGERVPEPHIPVNLDIRKNTEFIDKFRLIIAIKQLHDAVKSVLQDESHSRDIAHSCGKIECANTHIFDKHLREIRKFVGSSLNAVMREIIFTEWWLLEERDVVLIYDDRYIIHRREDESDICKGWHTDGEDDELWAIAKRGQRKFGCGKLSEA